MIKLDEDQNNEKEKHADGLEDALSALGWVEEKINAGDSEEVLSGVIKRQSDLIKEQLQKITSIENKNKELQKELKNSENEVMNLKNNKPKMEENTEVNGSNIRDLESKLNQQRALNIKVTTEFQKELAGLKAELKKYQDTPQGIISEPTTSDDKIKEFNQVLKEREQIISELRENIPGLETKIEEIEKNNKELWDEIAEIEKDKESLKFQLKESNELTNSKSEEIFKLKEEISAIGSQNQNLLNNDAMKQSLGDELAIITVEKESISNENINLKKEISILNDNCTKMQNTIENLTQDLGKLSEESHFKTEKIGEVLREGDSYKNEYVILKEKFVALEKTNEQKNQDLDNIKLRLDEHLAENKEFKEQLGYKDATIVDLKKQIKEYSEQIQYMEADTVNMTDYEDLKNIIDNKDEVITLKEKMLFDLQKEIEDKNQNLQNLKEELKFIDELKIQIADKNEQLEKINEFLEEARKEIHEKDLLSEEMDALNKTAMEQDQQKRVLYDLIKKLKEKLLGNNAIIDRLEKKIDDMKGVGIKENIELDDLRKEHDDLEAELRQKNDLIETNDEDIKLLNDQVIEYKSKLEEIKLNLSENIEKIGNIPKLEEEIRKIKSELEKKEVNERNLYVEIQKHAQWKINHEREVVLLKEENIGSKKRIKILRRDLTKLIKG